VLAALAIASGVQNCTAPASELGVLSGEASGCVGSPYPPPIPGAYCRTQRPHPPDGGAGSECFAPPSPGGAFLSNDEIAARPDHYALGKAGPPECLPATMQVVASRRAPAEWENVH
jgi:hypothetical protein